MPKILIVEDDIALADMMCSWLRHARHVLDVVYHGNDAQQLIDLYQYDLLILDWELPGTDGIGICTAYRAGGGSSPILFLTGRADVQSKVQGLDAGADDYLAKPFEFEELLARVNALLRRKPVTAEENLQVDDLLLDLQLREARLGGTKVALTGREFSLLEHLMRHVDSRVSSQEILEAVWTSESECSEATVRSTIRHLRKKLSPDGEGGPIQTVAKGYILSSKNPNADNES